MDVLFKLLDLLGRVFVWLPQGKLDRNVVGILKDLLTQPGQSQQRFETLLHDSAIYEETPQELRKVLIRLGARRYKGSDGAEYWGFPNRNQANVPDDPYPLAWTGIAVAILGVAAAVLALRLLADPDTQEQAALGEGQAAPVAAPDSTPSSAPSAPEPTALPRTEIQTQTAAPALGTPTEEVTDGAKAPGALDCVVRVTSPFVNLRASPGFSQAKGGRVAQGPYDVKEIRLVPWANRTDYWVRIETEGRVGWIPPARHQLDLTGRDCP